MRTGTARSEKVAVVEDIRERLAAADAAVLTEYRGLTVAGLADLRRQLRPIGADYKVFKNTLARRAVQEAGLGELVSMLEGPTAFTFVRGDAVGAAKVLRDFGKANPALVVKGGLLGIRVLSPRDVDVLADVAPRDVLLARLAGGFQAPMAKAAGLFQAFTRNAAYAFKALLDQRSAGTPTSGSTADDETESTEEEAAPGAAEES